jgi:hypothetical protein
MGCERVIYEQYPDDGTTSDVVFDSAWTTAIGTSDIAVRDGDRWTSTDGSGAPLEVTTGGPAGTNLLQVPRHGAGQGDQSLHLLNFLPAGETFYVRFYLGSDDTTSQSDDELVGLEQRHYIRAAPRLRTAGPSSRLRLRGGPRRDERNRHWRQWRWFVCGS